MRRATEVQKPMNNTKWIYWVGRLEREWPGEKGVYVRERARAENILLMFFWRSRRAGTQQQGCQHPPTASAAPGPILFTTERGISIMQCQGTTV